MNRRTVLTGSSRHRVTKELKVRVACENHLTVVATLNDVLRLFGQDNIGVGVPCALLLGLRCKEQCWANLLCLTLRFPRK